MNKEICALKLVDEIILYYDARSKKHQNNIFRQPLHVSGVSRPIIRRYNRMYTTIGTYYSWLGVCLVCWSERTKHTPSQE